MAGREALRVKDRHGKIKFGYIRVILEQYGQFRLDDLIREHSHQCPEMAAVLNAFRGQRSRYTTIELLELLQKHLQSSKSLELDGMHVTDPLVVCDVLFRIGFFVGRIVVRGRFEYVTFEDNPDWFGPDLAPPSVVSWDIHPAFLAALGLKYAMYEFAGDDAIGAAEAQ